MSNAIEMSSAHPNVREIVKKEVPEEKGLFDED